MRARTISQALSVVAASLVLGGDPAAQGQAAPKPPQAQQPREVIRRAFDLIRADVIVRDANGQFIADLKKEEFEVYEDGVKQELQSFLLTHGGRTYNQAAPPVMAMEGIILPQTKPTNDAAGRIFLIFVDDLHLDFNNTGRIRDVFKRIATELIHEGDLFGIVSTGPSSIAIDLTYDRKRLDEAIKKVSGAGMKPKEILDSPVGADGPPEIKYRSHVAFSTAYDLLKTLEQVHDRRKSFIYVSNGYDFNPFPKTRDKLDAEKWATPNKEDGSGASSGDDMATNPFNRQGTRFSEADLAAELSELTRQANRANTTLYTIDPRGLVGGPDLDQDLDMMEWQNHILTTQNSLRVLADLTGGFAVVNQNDFSKALKRIDAETSDYYVVGYFSSNPDPLKRTRKIEVKVARPNVQVRNLRQSYTLKPNPGPAPSSSK